MFGTLRLALGQLRFQVPQKLAVTLLDLKKAFVQMNLADRVELRRHDTQESHLVVGEEAEDGQHNDFRQIQQVDRTSSRGSLKTVQLASF